ncbi:hypothetical protein ACXR0O_28150 [Verrucomicrobiota bacterium sgz303538]
MAGAVGAILSQWHWYDLPGNAKTRVIAVTQGTKHHIDFPTRSWNAHYRKVFSRPLSVYTLPRLLQREHGGAGAISATPSTVIWFQSDTTGIVSFEATLVTADGQTYVTRAANGASTDGSACTGLQFQVVPPDPSLHLNATINGRNLDFEIPNPVFRKK